MRGLIQLQNTLAMIRENLNPDVQIEGILPTLVDSPHGSREGGDRAAGGELRRSRLRFPDHQDGALRGGARQGHVGAQVRPGRQSRVCLPGTGHGGSWEWQAAVTRSGRACERARWRPLFRKTEEEGCTARESRSEGGRAAAGAAAPRARSSPRRARRDPAQRRLEPSSPAARTPDRPSRSSCARRRRRRVSPRPRRSPSSRRGPRGASARCLLRGHPREHDGTGASGARTLQRPRYGREEPTVPVAPSRSTSPCSRSSASAVPA